jgi:predicted alpha/beta hydrolase family esterase
MPRASFPSIDAWVERIGEIADPDQDSHFVGYSLGAQAVLRYLTSAEPYGHAFLVAPSHKINLDAVREATTNKFSILPRILRNTIVDRVVQRAAVWSETPIAWTDLRGKANYHCFFSGNDPFIPEGEKALLEERLNPEIYMIRDGGHFDTRAGYQQFPQLKQAILEVTGEHKTSTR